MELEVTGKELLQKLSGAAESLANGDVNSVRAVLVEAHNLLDPRTPTGQALLESIGIDLPSTLARFVVIPDEACQEMAEAFFKTVLEYCDPRDMFTAYMEALHLYSQPEALAMCPIILDGLPKIFSRLRRRRVEYVKESISGLLQVSRLAVDTGIETWKVFDKLVNLVMVLHDLGAHEEVQEQRHSLQKVLGIFVLMILARFSVCNQSDGANYSTQSLFVQLAKLLPQWGFSYMDMITGSLIEKLIDLLTEDFCSNQVFIDDMRQGGLLAVWWRFCSTKAVDNGWEERKSLVDGLRSSRHVVGALCNVLILLSPKERSWKKVEMAIDTLAAILEGGIMPLVESPYDGKLEVLEGDEYLKLKELLQVIQNVLIFSPEPKTRQHAYKALVDIIRRVLPPAERFDVLKSLISECDHSSMISLLLYVAKEEAGKAIASKGLAMEGGQPQEEPPFASGQVLELIDVVLRPPLGGPPNLPDQMDAVLAALNLYRFLLIKETTGKTNFTGIGSSARLQEACSKWLHPLRDYLGGFRTNFDGDDSEATAALLLALSNLEGVLYRCLELAEAAMKPS